MEQDRNDLNILSIFYYISAGLGAVAGCFPLLYLVAGIAVLNGRFAAARGSSAPPAFLGWFFILFAVMFFLVIWGIVVVQFLAGRYLSQRKHYLYCQIMAGLTCTSVPFGTILGIFTFVVLSRPTVRALFTAPPPTADFAGE